MSDCEARYAKHVPSTRQIAHIAAILAHGNPTAAEYPLVMADQAIKLWDACASMRRGKISEGGKMLREMEKDFAELAAKATKLKRIVPIETPSSYPVPFDECLRLLMPNKKRPEDRLKIYRDYIRDSLQVSTFMERGNWSGKPFESTPIPSDEEVAKIITKNKAQGFSESWYGTTRELFFRWLPDYEAKKLSARAKKGAAAKWKKKLKNA